MESWDAWEAELQERLAELTNEETTSSEPVRRRTWVRFIWVSIGLPWG